MRSIIVQVPPQTPTHAKRTKIQKSSYVPATSDRERRVSALEQHRNIPSQAPCLLRIHLDLIPTDLFDGLKGGLPSI